LAGSDLEVRPRDDEVEISVFGPGYGECVVLDLAKQQWVIVDSCFGSTSQQPSALEYLERLGVDVGSRVRVVLATHYHDDHISGVGEVFENCKSARFACSMALNSDDWTKLIGIDRNYLIADGSGINEINRVMTSCVRALSPKRFRRQSFALLAELSQSQFCPLQPKLGACRPLMQLSWQCIRAFVRNCCRVRNGDVWLCLVLKVMTAQSCCRSGSDAHLHYLAQIWRNEIVLD
jgi:hypothetical protein